MSAVSRLVLSDSLTVALIASGAVAIIWAAGFGVAWWGFSAQIKFMKQSASYLEEMLASERKSHARTQKAWQKALLGWEEEREVLELAADGDIDAAIDRVLSEELEPGSTPASVHRAVEENPERVG